MRGATWSDMVTTVAGVYDIVFGMRRCRINLTNRCYHLISRVANSAYFLDEDDCTRLCRKGCAAMTRKTYCGNLLWQSGLTLLALGSYHVRLEGFSGDDATTRAKVWHEGRRIEFVRGGPWMDDNVKKSES